MSRPLSVASFSVPNNCADTGATKEMKQPPKAPWRTAKTIIGVYEVAKFQTSICDKPDITQDPMKAFVTPIRSPVNPMMVRPKAMAKLRTATGATESWLLTLGTFQNLMSKN